MDGHISGALDGFRRGQLAEAFKHALIGERLDFFLGRIGSGQGSHKLVARGETEDVGHDVGVKAVCRGHAPSFDGCHNLGRRGDVG